MIMVSHNIRSPERCFSQEMGGEVDIILQPFFQVRSVGFWREKQSNFGSGVLTALANIDLLSGTRLFYHTSVGKGSKIFYLPSFHKYLWHWLSAGLMVCVFSVAFHNFL